MSGTDHAREMIKENSITIKKHLMTSSIDILASRMPSEKRRFSNQPLSPFLLGFEEGRKKRYESERFSFIIPVQEAWFSLQQKENGGKPSGCTQGGLRTFGRVWVRKIFPHWAFEVKYLLRGFMQSIPISHRTWMVLWLLHGVLFLSLGFPIVHAQEDGSQSVQHQINQDDLERFAQAYTEVTRIYNMYEQRIGQVNDSDTALALQQEGNQKMAQAVEGYGFSINEYNAMYQLIENNPSLQTRLSNILKESGH